MLSRKQTAWKKNQKFGDIHGGRTKLKHDKSITRLHNLKAPGQDVKTPIYIQDNPSKDFFFPISIDEVKFIVDSFGEHVNTLTHVWLRRVSTKDFCRGKRPFGYFVSGEGVRAIVLFAWPKNLTIPLGSKKPSQKTMQFYSKWQPILFYQNKRWNIRFSPENLHKFYLHLVFHELGHYFDRFNQRTTKKAEDFANNFASDNK